ncbi:hypothetical protein [Pseudomonas sp. TMP25]|uniref:hypothetical protein n=1 Tax=Pseudomonas sp. TMP25 TaxID=3136561 RepID=UPI003101556D
MRFRLGWRFWIVIILVAGAAVVAIKSVEYSRIAQVSEGNWLQNVAAWNEVVFSKILRPLPDTQGRKLGVKIYDENNWRVYRAYPSGQLDVFFNGAEGVTKRLNLSAGWRRDTFPMLIMSVKERLFIVGYDVVRNVPSGRSLSVIQPGFDVYQIDPDVQGEPRIMASGVDLEAGLDSVVYGRVLGSTVTLCAEQKCADINPDGLVIQWALDHLKDYEFVEVAFSTDSVYALVRKKWDDRIDGKITEDRARYSLAGLTSKGATIEPLSVDGIPYALTVNENKATWNVARSAQELRDLFLYEISRMRNGGLIDFGDNNLEGRVVWNQVYYLHGLLSVAHGGLAFSSHELEDYARKRVIAEIDLIARLSETDQPGFRVKRYSLDREPLLFALHIGRIAEVLSRADNQGLGTPAVKTSISKIKEELMSFQHTVEHPVSCHLQNVVECKTLGYRQGYPFWADGINVPLNYVSGYVSGLIAVADDKLNLGVAADLMRPLQVVEQFSEFPETWRYWAFEGQSGWSYSSGRSLNTPEWSGNGAGLDIAHVSYRSMDAMALLALNAKRPDVLKKPEIAHIKALVSKGMLLPSVNEAFYREGSPAVLDLIVARRYARSTHAWQIQSQVWALSDLVSTEERYLH